MASFYKFDSGLTLMSVTFTRSPINNELDTFIADLTRELKTERANTFGMLFRINVESAFDLGIEVPRKMSKWMEANERFIREHVTATAVQLSGVSATLLLKALFSIRKSARPCKVFGLDRESTVKALDFIAKKKLDD